jgi:hypothetical protein
MRENKGKKLSQAVKVNVKRCKNVQTARKGAMIKCLDQKTRK